MGVFFLSSDQYLKGETMGVFFSPSDQYLKGNYGHFFPSGQYLKGETMGVFFPSDQYLTGYGRFFSRVINI